MVELFTSDDSNSNTSKNSAVTTVSDRPDVSQKLGATSPLVKIAGHIINNIDSVIIDETGFIPKITMMFTDMTGEFGGSTFPKKNLRLSIYIKSPNTKLMPIRSDYLITSIKSISKSFGGNPQSLSKDVTYLVKGELFVPRIYNNISKSYSKMTSRDALFNIADQLGLGFAENDFTTSDSMTWINMNSSPLNFIKDVANHAYSDDDSFFEAFISKELNLSMIQVSQQLHSGEGDEMFMAGADSVTGDINQNEKGNGIKTALDDESMINHLTTDRRFVQNSNYIIEASLISNQGNILKDSGYQKKIYYYDHLSNNSPIEKFIDFNMAPINTPGVSEVNMLIPEEDGLDEVGVKKWMNINYGNTHTQWNAARLLNTHNNNELEKIQLRVVTRGINVQVIRGMSIRTFITKKVADHIQADEDPQKESQIELSEDNQLDETIDLQLSGIYYVKGAKYYYDAKKSTTFSTELFLARREWKESKIIIK